MVQRPDDVPEACEGLLDHFFEIEETTPKFICPKCKMKLGVNITYGYPTEEMGMQAERNEIVLGGYMQAIGQPDRQCLGCGNQWQIVPRGPRSASVG